MRKIVLLAAIMAANFAWADDTYEILSPHFRGWIILSGVETWVDGDMGAPATETEKKKAHKKYELRCWRCADVPYAEIVPFKEVAKKEAK